MTQIYWERNVHHQLNKTNTFLQATTLVVFFSFYHYFFKRLKQLETVNVWLTIILDKQVGNLGQFWMSLKLLQILIAHFDLFILIITLLKE